MPREGAAGHIGFSQAVYLACQQFCVQRGGRFLGILAIKQHIFAHLDANQLIRVFSFQVDILLHVGRKVGFARRRFLAFCCPGRARAGFLRHLSGGRTCPRIRCRNFRLRIVRIGRFPRGVPVAVKGNLNVLAVDLCHGPRFDIALLGDVIEPLLCEIVEAAPQLRNPFPRLRVDPLIDLDAAILLKGQRLQRPRVTVNPEGHFRVVHTVAIELIGVADGDHIIVDPLNMERHHGRPRLHAQIAVLTVGNFREQTRKRAVIQLGF